MVTAKVQQMNLREAKNWLEKGDSILISEKLGYNVKTIIYVLNMKRKNAKVEHAIIELATQRMNDYFESIEKILK